MKQKLSKFFIPFIIISILITLSSCNYQLFDTHYTYDYAIIMHPNGEEQKIEIAKWTDYEGEQLQIIDKNGKVYLVSSIYTILVAE